ncbi:MAG: saccharopine dehydrogenase family protein [Bacteroidales bacterium]|jgi:saccharopine dehydrogenase (NAD+, L-lysine-forming)|nr:saccharopine dehydrogenase family protein [Bacteroidales bacterium]
MGKVMIIGAGGVATATAHQLVKVPKVFEEVLIASRTKEKCDNIVKKINKGYFHTAQIDAMQVDELVSLIRDFKPDMVMNLALPYQNLAIMEACLQTGVSYLDTASYESPDNPHLYYIEQWSYFDKFKEAGITGILGCGFDPGVTGVFTAYAAKHYFDEIHYLDIVDCNAGDHGKYFATNFNAEINIREISSPGIYYKEGKWIETKPLEIHRTIAYPEIGERESYLLFHEELESLVKHYPTIKQARFWMTFSERYLTVLEVLQGLGLTSIKPIHYEGMEIIPLQFIKAILPDPATLGENYKGKVSIGVQLKGIYQGKERSYYIWSNLDHEKAYKETGTQAVAYSTGVPAMVGALMYMKDIWKKPGVYNVEQFDPDPFLEAMPKYGIDWQEAIDIPLPIDKAEQQ